MKRLYRKFQFKLACLKVRITYQRLIAVRLDIIKYCCKHLHRIGIPVTDSEKEMMKELIHLYDKVIDDLKKDINRYKSYIPDSKKEDNLQ